MANYNEIKSKSHIENLIASSSSDDGENIFFEIKGSNGKENFHKDLKTNLAKEICAFSNTYGGIICFHFGQKVNLQPFTESFCNENFNKIESWLRDSLEPRLAGIEIKIVDCFFIIKIPESRTKPHRTSKTKEYFYRHSTISQSMPEIMISSMYRSQDYLNFSTDVNLVRLDSRYCINILVQNHSNISGTKPKIQIQLEGNLDKMLTLEDHDYIQQQNSGYLPKKDEDFKILLMASTNYEFSNEILYPKDKITQIVFTKQHFEINNLENLII